MEENIRVCDHPLIMHKLSFLRQHKDFINFRDYEALTRELGILLAYEASRDHLHTIPFDTEELTKQYQRRSSDEPWRPGEQVADRPVIVPVVRAGLVMAHAMREIIPTAYMGHIGLFPDKKGNPKEFLVSMPTRILGRKFFLVDMFITRGQSAARAIEILLEHSVPAEDIVFIALVVSPEGASFIRDRTDFSGVSFYCARLDTTTDPTSTDNWMKDFDESNFRLFRTRNHRSLMEGRNA